MQRKVALEEFVHTWFRPPAPTQPFPLTDNMFGTEEVVAMMDVMLSGQLTYGPRVQEFEAAFAAYLGVPYAVMVNSGSSANLLAVAAAINPKRKHRLYPGDAVLVPAVCWSTSVAPLLQLGCVPIYADVDIVSGNLATDDLEALVARHQIKGIMAVHVIGGCCNMTALQQVVARHHLILMEDTCESLGSTYDGKALGTLGSFGTYSLYFSHHITCGEGGVVVCHTPEDYDLLLMLRAHGWTRHLPDAPAVEAQYPEMDSRFLFVNTGFNVRPMSLQAVMATEQLKKLPAFVRARRTSYDLLTQALDSAAPGAQRFDIIRAHPGVEAAWFGFALVLRPAYWHQLAALKQHLSAAGIEHRPIISGNMVRQPFNALYNLQQVPQDFPGAEYLHQGGLFLGLHSSVLTAEQVALVARTVGDFAWLPQKRVLVTGGSGMLGHALQDQWADDTAAVYRFVSSRDCDLSNAQKTLALFQTFRPTHVVHAAARVGGLYMNMTDHMQMGVTNVQLNTSVLQAAEACNVQHLVAISSTCIYPSALASFAEADMNEGAPHDSNAEYAISKRLLHVQLAKIRRTRGFPWQILIPCNLYGPHDTFSTAHGHVIAGLIVKACSADPTLVVCGTGQARRQFMYVKDLARLIAQVLTSPGPDLICAPPGDVSISDVATLIGRQVGKQLTYDTSQSDGQMRKTGRTALFQQQFPQFKWTPLAEGLQQTLDWYKGHHTQ